MQEINIASWCDLHAERDHVRMPGEEVIIGVTDTWRRIDLCSTCMSDVLGPIEAAITKHGVLVSKHDLRKRRPSGRTIPASEFTEERMRSREELRRAPRPCLWCSVVANSPDQLNSHLYQRHGFDRPAKAYGRICPICRETYERLYAHIGKKHGMKIADAFQWAIHSDDPKARDVAVIRRAAGVNVTDPGPELQREVTGGQA